MSTGYAGCLKVFRSFVRPQRRVVRKARCPNLPPSRHYNRSPIHRVYPEEGVFQPNSPPHPELTRVRSGRQYQAYEPPQHGALSPKSTRDAPPYNGRGFRRRMIAFMLAYSCFAFFGYLDHHLYIIGFESFIKPPLDPDSEEDRAAALFLLEQYHGLMGVQNIRARAQQGNFELEEWAAYSGLDSETQEGQERRANLYTTGPLGGSRGLGAQFFIRDKESNTLYCILNFGRGLGGGGSCIGSPDLVHPVVHTGAISTVFDEVLGREAMRRAGNRAAVTAQLEIDFNYPVVANNWYIIIVAPASDATPASKQTVCGKLHKLIVEPSRPDQSQDVPNEMHAEPCAHCHGTYVVPASLDLPPIPHHF